MLWTEVACVDKVHVLAVIQQVIEVASWEVTAHKCQFQVTTSLATKLTMIAWRLLGLDDLANGLTPFLLAPQAPHECAEQQQQASLSHWYCVLQYHSHACGCHTALGQG